MTNLKPIFCTAVWSSISIVALLCATPVHAQVNYPGTSVQTYPGQRPSRNTPASDINNMGIEGGSGHGPDLAQRQATGRNAERQRKLVEDTDKLLTLATQLKTDVDKTNKDILSIDVVKRAEEIEKLAKSVKERMKG
jgi:hypothetical protein